MSSNTVSEIIKGELELLEKIDGLIFTPANSGVGSDVVGKEGKLKNETWKDSFKWKPPEFNTIDFLITTKKNKEVLVSLNKKGKFVIIDIEDNELINRLKNRGHDNDFINKRMKLAAQQREKKSQYQYHVDNVDINTSVNQILDIIYSLEES